MRGVPKNGVLRSKHLLKPQPLPRHYWGLELRTSLTKAGDGAKCGAKFVATFHVIYIEVTSASQMPKEMWRSRQENHVLWLKISETRATNSGVAFAGDPESNGG